MPKLIIDGQQVECRPGIPVLQAALDAGMSIPHYCYHPGLSVVASCRLCLMEMKMPHPKTGELSWAPKLVPSCQTPVKDGMEVRFNSPAVADNYKHVMEYYLLNHPLDCPVCDKAGECYLQDYTEDGGPASSRMVDEKSKNPKKDIGPRTLLYQDRCVLCTRCVRFCEEVAGTGELRVVNRGSRGEIDVFPGEPLANPLQGNVVDLCPVGALLDKGFLFKQRVWMLQSTKSVSPVDSQGQTIWIDHNHEGLHRVRPRYNEKVNTWWISDEARFGWKFIYREDRLRQPMVRTANGGAQPTTWEALPNLLRGQLVETVAAGGRIAAVLSPMMACEEAYLLAQFIRKLSADALLVVGHVPLQGQDQKFPKGFVVKAEKCPNRRGIETLLQRLGGPTGTLGDLLQQASAGRIGAAYVVGGYPETWVTPAYAEALARVKYLVTHDLFPSALDAHAAVRIPATSWAEREGAFMNDAGLLQAFDRALAPLDGLKSDGQFFYELVGKEGLFRAGKVRAALAQEVPAFAEVFEPQPLPEHAH